MNPTTTIGVLNSGADALRGLGVELPHIPSANELPEYSSLPWSYYVLSGFSLAGAVTALATAILGQTPLLIVGGSLMLSAGLGAYEVKRLSLDKRFESLIGTFHDMVTAFVQQVSILAKERTKLQQANGVLATEISELKSLEAAGKSLQGSIQMYGNITEKLEVAKEKIEEDAKVIGGLKEEKDTMQKTIGQLEGDKKELGVTLGNLQKQYDTEKATVASLQEHMTTFEVERKKFEDGIKTAQTSEKLAKAELELLKLDNRDLKANITKLSGEIEKNKQDHQNLADIFKKSGIIEEGLGKSIESLSAKIDKHKDIKKENRKFKEQLEAAQEAHQLEQEAHQHELDEAHRKLDEAQHKIDLLEQDVKHFREQYQRADFEGKNTLKRMNSPIELVETKGNRSGVSSQNRVSSPIDLPQSSTGTVKVLKKKKSKSDADEIDSEASTPTNAKH